MNYRIEDYRTAQPNDGATAPTSDPVGTNFGHSGLPGVDGFPESGKPPSPTDFDWSGWTERKGWFEEAEKAEQDRLDKLPESYPLPSPGITPTASGDETRNSGERTHPVSMGVEWAERRRQADSDQPPVLARFGKDGRLARISDPEEPTSEA